MDIIPSSKDMLCPDPAPLARAALAVQEALTRLLSENGGTDLLVGALGSLMSSAAVLEVTGLSRLESRLPEEPGAEERLRPLLSLRTSPAAKTLLEAGRQPKTPISLSDDYSGLRVYRLVAVVAAGGERLGYLSLLRTDRSFDGGEQAALQHAAALFAVHLAQQKRLEALELRLKGNFVDDLVSLRYSDPESILSRARALDFDLSLPHRVLVGEIENIGQLLGHMSSDGKATAKFWAGLVGSVQVCLDGAGGSSGSAGMAIHNNDEIIMLVRQDSATSPIAPARTLAEDIIAAVSPHLRARLFIGIGNTTRALTDYQQSYLEAKKALEIGAYMITEGQVRSFEQFKVHALFLSTLKPAALYAYARSQLGALLTYDAEHRTELVKTLQEFLYLRNNVEGTAKSLVMSVSGLKYRLSRIERVTGFDLRDYKVCFDLQLSFIILQLFGDYRIRDEGVSPP